MPPRAPLRRAEPHRPLVPAACPTSRKVPPPTNLGSSSLGTPTPRRPPSRRTDLRQLRSAPRPLVRPSAPAASAGSALRGGGGGGGRRRREGGSSPAPLPGRAAQPGRRRAAVRLSPAGSARAGGPQRLPREGLVGGGFGRAAWLLGSVRRGKGRGAPPRLRWGGMRGSRWISPPRVAGPGSTSCGLGLLWDGDGPFLSDPAGIRAVPSKRHPKTSIPNCGGGSQRSLRGDTWLRRCQVSVA